MAVSPPEGYTLDEPELQSPVAPAPKSTPTPKPKKTVAAPKGYVVDEPATHTGDAESVFEKNLPSLGEDSLTKGKTPPRKTYGEFLGEGLAQGAGSLVEGAIGNTVGMVADPINALIHGGQPSLGTATREMLGLPDNPDKVVDATIQGGAAGLSTAGLAKGFANLLAKGGVGALSAAELGAMPGIDTIAGAAGGFASGKADELGYGELGQLAAALGGGAAGYALAKKFVNLAKNFGKELVQIDDTGRPFVRVQEADGTYTTYYDLEGPDDIVGTVTDDALTNPIPEKFRPKPNETYTDRVTRLNTWDAYVRNSDIPFEEKEALKTKYRDLYAEKFTPTGTKEEIDKAYENFYTIANDLEKYLETFPETGSKQEQDLWFRGQEKLYDDMYRAEAAVHRLRGDEVQAIDKEMSIANRTDEEQLRIVGRRTGQSNDNEVGPVDISWDDPSIEDRIAQILQPDKDPRTVAPINPTTANNATPLPANDAYGPKSFEHAAADFEDAKAAWNEKEFIKLVKSAQESPDLELRSIADHYWATRTAVETSDVSQFTLPEIDEILDGLTPLTFQTNDIGTIASKTTELLSNLRQQYLRSVGAEDLTSDKAKVFLKEKGFTNKQLYEMPATKAMQTAIDEGYSASGVTKQGPESVGGDEPPTEGPDVVTRLTEALKTAGKAREDQDELYRQARAEKFRKVREAQQPGRGQQAYFDSLAALKGELPKADFEEVGSQFTQREVDDLFDVVLKTKTLTDSGKLNAHTGLMKVLNGTVPTPKELELLGEAFPADFVKEIVAKRGIISKSFGTFGEVWNLPKSAMSTFDLSAPFRQGLGLSNRKEFWKGLGPMVKYAFSPKSYKAMDEWIKTHPTYALAEEAGLAITTTGGKGQSEDIFSSHIAEKIPGYGKIVQGSERAYVGFLNKLRFDTFNALVEQGRAAGIDFDADPKAAKGIANYINVMTGRGGLGKAEPAAGVLNGIFFSPRLISSRLQMLAAPAQAVAGKGFIAELPPELRMEAAKSYAAMTAMYATTLSLASFAGHQVTMDPLSSDFGKIKDGNTRIDAGGGLLQYITIGARALMRQSTSLKSGETRDLTGRGDTPLDADIKFILNKMHPSLTLIADQQRGTNVVGEPFKWQSALLDRLTPMGIPDIVDTLKEHPNQTGAFYAVLGLLGYGLQNFDENATPAKEESATPSPPEGYK